MRGTWRKLQGRVPGPLILTSPPQPCSVEVRGGFTLLPPPQRRNFHSEKPSTRWLLAARRRSRRLLPFLAMISADLLEVLACPKCKRKVQVSEDGSALTCETDRLRYPVVDGIPVMLVEEAQPY